MPGGQADRMDNQDGKMDVCAHGDQRARICEGLACLWGGGGGRTLLEVRCGAGEGFALPTPPLEQGET